MYNLNIKLKTAFIKILFPKKTVKRNNDIDDANIKIILSAIKSKKDVLIQNEMMQRGWVNTTTLIKNSIFKKYKISDLPKTENNYEYKFPKEQAGFFGTFVDNALRYTISKSQSTLEANYNLAHLNKYRNDIERIYILTLEDLMYRSFKGGLVALNLKFEAVSRNQKGLPLVIPFEFEKRWDEIKEKNFEIIKNLSKGNNLLNPDAHSDELRIKGDADMIHNNTLIEIKCTIRPYVSQAHYRQLMVYRMNIKHSIEKYQVWFPLQGKILEFPIDPAEAECIPEIIENRKREINSLKNLKPKYESTFEELYDDFANRLLSKEQFFKERELPKEWVIDRIEKIISKGKYIGYKELFKEVSKPLSFVYFEQRKKRK